MSEKYPTDHERGQLRFKCDRCGAQPGEWCTTKNGNVSTYIHTFRGVRKTSGGFMILLPARDDDPVE